MDPTSWLERLAQLPAGEPFTTGMAQEIGLSRQALNRLTKTGFVRQLLVGVYVRSDVSDSIALRCRALALVIPDDCFVCDRTAAWIHAGARALGPDEHLGVPPISCFRPSDHGRLRNKLTASGEREILPRDLMEIHGIVVTTPLRTAVDLGRLQRTPDLRLHGMDTMLGLRRFSHEQLLAEVPRFNRRRGVVLLRVLAPLADPGSQSFGESALRLRWHHANLPSPRTQVPIEVDGRVLFYLDMGLEELLFAAEYHGEAWHTSDEQVEHDEERLDFLVRKGRWAIEVFWKQHVFGVRQNAEERLKAGYLHARATLGTRTFII
jgi:hypothetical protein